jgi:hypothetical protein
MNCTLGRLRAPNMECMFMNYEAHCCYKLLLCQGLYICFPSHHTPLSCSMPMRLNAALDLLSQPSLISWRPRPRCWMAHAPGTTALLHASPPLRRRQSNLFTNLVLSPGTFSCTGQLLLSARQFMCPVCGKCIRYTHTHYTPTAALCRGACTRDEGPLRVPSPPCAGGGQNLFAQSVSPGTISPARRLCANTLCKYISHMHGCIRGPAASGHQHLPPIEHRRSNV